MSEATTNATVETKTAKDKKSLAKSIAEKAKAALGKKPVKAQVEAKPEVKPQVKVEAKAEVKTEVKTTKVKGVTAAKLAVIRAVSELGGKDIPIETIKAAVFKAHGLSGSGVGHQLYHSYKDAPFYLTRTTGSGKPKPEFFSITEEGRKLLK